jgi:hypothetical protein
LKLLRLKNKIIITTGQFSSLTPICELNVALKLYVYGCIKKCAGSTQKSYKIWKMRTLKRAKSDTKHKRLELGGGQAYGLPND